MKQVRDWECGWEQEDREVSHGWGGGGLRGILHRLVVAIT